MRIGLSEWLERTLSTTNTIENLNGSVRRITRNVKRWDDGRMVLRWIAAALAEAAKGFRKLRATRVFPSSWPRFELTTPRSESRLTNRNKLT